MKKSFGIITLFVSVCFAATAANSEVDFPKTRNAVGPDEFYVLRKNGDWDVWCLRDKNSEDACYTETEISDFDAGFNLSFSVTPLLVPQEPSRADVDLIPQTIVNVYSSSNAEQYGTHSAAISELDGEPFDGYWCEIEDGDCLRGPYLDYSATQDLLSAKTATIQIFRTEDQLEKPQPVSTLSVDLSDLRKGFEAANAFNASIHDLRVTELEDNWEMCDFVYEGQQKRISYTYDEDFDAESTSWRELMLGPQNGSCPSYVVLAYMTPDMTPVERDLFCLVPSEDGEGYIGFQQGIQAKYRTCKTPSKSFCQRVNNTKEAALALTGFATGAVGSAVGATTVTGTTVVAHSSGAAIITGSGGYVGGTLGTAGTTALAILTAPETLAAAAVSVVAVGGAVYFCSE